MRSAPPEAAIAAPRSRERGQRIRAISSATALPPAAVVAFVALAAWRRSVALDPPSLFVDDTWVGFIVRYASLGDLFVYAATAPTGFSAILKGFAQLVPDPELGLQLYPFLCGLILIPAVGLLAMRLTGWVSIGVLAAALTSVDPMIAIMSTHVKQTASDALVVLLLVILGLPHIRDASPRRLLGLSVASAVAAVVSYVSLAASMLLLHLPLAAAAREWRRDRRRPPWAAVAVVFAFDAAMLAFYWLRLRLQMRSDVEAYWIGWFLPTGSLAAAAEFAARRIPAALTGGSPQFFGWPTAERVVAVVIGIAMLAGIVSLFARERSRFQAAFFLLFFAGLLAASALHLYPFGGRPFFFTHPLWLALAAAGLGAVCDAASSHIAGARRVLPAVLWVLAIATVLAPWKEIHYAKTRAAEVVRYLDEHVAPDELVYLSPQAQHTVGYYTTRPIEPVFDNGGEKFTFRAVGWNVLVQQVEGKPVIPPERLVDQRRVYHFAARGGRLKPHNWKPLWKKLTRAGFRHVEARKELGTRLNVYER